MNEQSLFPNQPKGMTLTEFNALVERAVNGRPELQRQWVVAETSDLRVSRGHCYMELIEKDSRGISVAKVGAVVWASNYARLAGKFMAATGTQLKTGMKVLVQVSANFHSLYGFKVVVGDIDPAYTLGDMERQRIEIINRLKAEGIIDMNKQLPWPAAPQRVAIVSSAGAAGYGDFMNQLMGNHYGLQFYTCLFQAVMQGEQTVPSVMQALERIYSHIDLFDCVVIIRGGGATSELNSFDNYDLAAHVAQFPLPVVVGIGHERDVTVLDYVASMRVKTPTAAAEWLIQCGANALTRLDELKTAVASTVRETASRARENLAYYGSMIPATARRIIDTNRVRLDAHARNIPIVAHGLIAAQRARLDHMTQRQGDIALQAVQRERQRLQALADKVSLLSPEGTLQRGYSLVMKNGKCVTAATALTPGDNVAVYFAQGSAAATINHVDNQHN